MPRTLEAQSFGGQRMWEVGKSALLEVSGMQSSEVPRLGVMKDKGVLELQGCGKVGREGLIPGLPFLGLGAMPP